MKTLIEDFTKEELRSICKKAGSSESFDSELFKAESHLYDFYVSALKTKISSLAYQNNLSLKNPAEVLLNEKTKRKVVVSNPEECISLVQLLVDDEELKILVYCRSTDLRLKEVDLVGIYKIFKGIKNLVSFKKGSFKIVWACLHTRPLIETERRVGG